MKPSAYFVICIFWVVQLNAQIPNRQWSTYHGGSNEDSFRDMAIDASGNVYVVGSTRSTNGIITPPSSQSVIGGGSDVFIAKYDRDGNRIWATYFGGAGDDFGQSIDLDANGNIFVTGLTFSSNGIATAGAHQSVNSGNGDTFVAKFSNAGNVIWGSYLGGANFDFANDIEIDMAGNPIIIGWTSSPGLSSVGAYQTNYGGQDDVLFAKFDTNGQLQWSTYIGDVGFDTGLQVESDASGNITVSGWTSSTVNIASPGAHQTAYGGNTADNFLAVFNSNGGRIWSTYYGGSGDDYGDALLVTSSGDIYLSGSTNSPNNIASPTAFQVNVSSGFDVFLARFSATGIRSWATYFGGNGNESAYRLRQGNDAAIYMTGNTSSSNVMATPNALQTNKSGGVDAFLSRFENSGNLTWSTYYGGNSNDLGFGLVLDADDQIFVNGNTEGSTNLSTINATQIAFGGGPRDGFVAKFAPCIDPVLNFTNSGFTCGSVDYVFEMELLGLPPFTIHYSIDGVSQTPWTTNNTNFFPVVNGNLWTKIIKIDSVKSGDCKGVINSAFGFVQVRDSIRSTDPVITCDDATSTYTVSCDLTGGAFGGFSSVGTTTGFINGSTDRFVSTPIPYGSNYSIAFVESGTFSNCDTIKFNGISPCSTPCPNLTPVITSNSPICSGSNLSLSVTQASSYMWSGPDNFTSSIRNPQINTIATAQSGMYTVTITDLNGCTGSQTVTIVVNQNPNPNITTNAPQCTGSTLTFSTIQASSYMWSGPVNFTSTIRNPQINTITTAQSGMYTVTITDLNGCTGSQTVSIIVNQSPSPNVTTNAPQCTGSTLTFSTTQASSYAWSGPNNFTSTSQNPNFPNAQTILTGTYTVTVTATNGCTGTASSTNVIIHPKPIANIDAINPICEGTNLSLMGSGGTTYAWTGPNNFQASGQNPIITAISQNQAGIYRLIVSNSFGCMDSTESTISVLPKPIAIATANTPLCIGSTLRLQASGGTSYVWSGPSNFFSTFQNPTLVNAPQSAAGLYTVIVTSANGCTNSSSVNVDLSGQLSVSITSNSPICEGDSLILMANGGSQFLWTGPSGSQIGSGKDIIIPITTVVSQGTYTLQVTDASGCSGIRQSTVIVIPKPIATISSHKQVCIGETVTIEASGGDAYLWNNGNTTGQIETIVNEPTTFIVTVTTGICSDTAMTTISLFDEPSVSGFSNISISQGDQKSIELDPTFTYSWTPAEGISCIDCHNPIFSPSTTTEYCVNITNAEGCSIDTCFTIQVVEVCKLDLANIFSPDDDGNNDTWCSREKECISRQILTIYDRWGNKLYTQEGSSVCWDGTGYGKEMQPQVCTYILSLDMIDGFTEYKTGTIMVVR